MAKRVTEETKPKAKGKSKKDGPKADPSKKRGATGATLGLNVGQTWLTMLETNIKKKRTDAEMVEFMCDEFPENKTYTVEDIRLHRNLYNRGRIRDQEPFGEELDEDDKLHEYAAKDGKKVKLPLKAKRTAGSKKKGKKSKTEDVADDVDFDDEDDDEDDDDEEEPEPAPKKGRRKGKK